MGTVSFEVPGPGTYQVQCDPSLTPLTDPAAAGDVLAGKKFYNDQTQAVTGTLVPGSDTSDATATAGDILAPKTAYVAAGKVTGTIATKGAGDVTADGPLVAVPPGYYPQAVNKTVSDPDLIPGNIKAGVDIFGVTGTLASQFAAVLVVTVDAGAEVTATDGTTTLTETSTGTATFHLPNGGTWTVSATLDGSQAAPATVEVQENFSVALSAGASQTVNITTQYEAELSFSRLPAGYTELQYITTNHYTSIETDVSGTTHTTKIVCDIEPIEKVTNYYASIFCIVPITTYVGDVHLVLQSKSSTMVWYAGPSSSSVKNGSFTYNLANGVRITIELDGPGKEIKMGTSSFDFSPVACSAGNAKIRFGHTYGATLTLGLSMKIYSAKAYVDGDLKGDFLPCKNPDGKVGMYNLSTGYFCKNVSNLSGGEPSAGPAV